MSEPIRMDEAEPIKSNVIAIDWWILAAAAQAWLSRARVRDPEDGPSWVGGPDTQGYKLTLFTAQGVGRVMADIYFIKATGLTQIRIQGHPANIPFFQELIAFLELLGADAANLQRQYEPSPDQVVERYYRARAQGSKITLKQLALDTGFSYGYLRTVKIAYDKAGKWGSKKKLSSAHDKEI